jgi:hypothetical protein
VAQPIESNGRFSLELAEDITSITCSHCGKQLKSVCGFITRKGDAYSTYFALLHTGHNEIVVLLTISIGKWWDDEAFNERHWVAITVRPSETQFNMRIEEPDRSRHVNWKPLGIPLSRNDALASPLRKAFFEVADFIVEQDPTVNSYLKKQEIKLYRKIPNV